MKCKSLKDIFIDVISIDRPSKICIIKDGEKIHADNYSSNWFLEEPRCYWLVEHYTIDLFFELIIIKIV